MYSIYSVVSRGRCREWKMHFPENRLQRSLEVGQVRNYISHNAKGSRQVLEITNQAREETDKDRLANTFGKWKERHMFECWEILSNWVLELFVLKWRRVKIDFTEMEESEIVWFKRRLPTSKVCCWGWVWRTFARPGKASTRSWGPYASRIQPTTTVKTGPIDPPPDNPWFSHGELNYYHYFQL